MTYLDTAHKEESKKKKIMKSALLGHDVGYDIKSDGCGTLGREYGEG